MVRQKSRWILVRLDFDDHFLISSRSKQQSRKEAGGDAQMIQSAKRRRLDHSTLPVPSAIPAPVPIEAKDIHRVLRSAMESNFGTIGAGMAHTIRICCYDETDRLAILKVGRDNCPMVRAALTLISSINDVNVVMSTISIHGSARTAKIAALTKLRRDFAGLGQRRAAAGGSLTKQEEKMLLQFEARMDKIRDID